MNRKLRTNKGELLVTNYTTDKEMGVRSPLDCDLIISQIFKIVKSFFRVLFCVFRNSINLLSYLATLNLVVISSVTRVYVNVIIGSDINFIAAFLTECNFFIITKINSANSKINLATSVS